MRKYSITIEHQDATFPLKVMQYQCGIHRRKHVHKHAEFEIVYVPHDSGTFIYDGSELRFGANDLILNSPNTYHHPIFDNADNQGLIVMYFLPSLLDVAPAGWLPAFSALQSQIPNACRLKNHSEAAKLMKEALFHFTQGRSQWEIECQGALLHLLSIFAAEILRTSDTIEDRSGALTLPSVLRFIDENLAHRIEASELYFIAGMSKSSFCRQFKKYTGLTAPAYIKQLRVKRAKSFLIDTDYSVSQIAYACGYESLSLFNRVFKEATNMSPTEFRSLI